MNVNKTSSFEASKQQMIDPEVNRGVGDQLFES